MGPKRTQPWAIGAGLLLLAASMAPVLLVDVPAMADYSNHLARMHVLVDNDHPYYEVRWSLYPNLAMDLVVPPLAKFMTVEGAAKAFLLLSQVLVVAGAMALEFATKRRIALSAFVAPATLYSLPFAWGFVNFQFGLGVALWSIATWLLMRGNSVVSRLIVHSICVFVLFISHLVALGIYGFTIGLYELWKGATQRAALSDALTRFGVMVAPALLVLAFGALTGPSLSATKTLWSASSKLATILWWMNGYDHGLAAAGAIAVCVSIFIVRPKPTPPGTFVMGGLFILFLAMPNWLFDTAFIDVRLLTAVALVAPAFLVVSGPGKRAIIVTSTLIVFTLVNSAHAAFVWRSYRDDFVQFRESFQQIQRGSFVLTAHSGDARIPPQDWYEYPLFNGPTLAAAYSRALVPALFTHPGKQPIALKPSVRDFDGLQSGPVPLKVLTDIASGRGDDDVAAFVQQWHRRYDYLYVVGGKVANPLPSELSMIFSGDRFVLYRVTRS